MGHCPAQLERETRQHYCQLMGNAAWRRLHPAIRERFSDDQQAFYMGVMDEIYLSAFGLILANLCRLIDTPLALHRGEKIPVTVSVYFDEKLRGYTWDRFYHFPQKLNRVRSTKCISRDLGLIECLGRGLGMRLKVREQKSGIEFQSVEYFWQWKQQRFRLPRILSPGVTTVRQTAIDTRKFRFDLTLVHPLLGCLARQSGVFSAIREDHLEWMF